MILHRCGASEVGAADGVDVAPIVDVVDKVDAVAVVGAVPGVEIELTPLLMPRSESM